MRNYKLWMDGEQALTIWKALGTYADTCEDDEQRVKADRARDLIFTLLEYIKADEEAGRAKQRYLKALEKGKEEVHGLPEQENLPFLG